MFAFQEGVEDIIKVHEEGRGGHSKREFLHELQWVTSNASFE